MGNMIGNAERSGGVAPWSGETGEAGAFAGERRSEGRQRLGEVFAALGELCKDLGMGKFRVEVARGCAEGERRGRRLRVEAEGCPNCSDLPDALGRSCAFGEILRGLLESFDCEGLSLREIKHRNAGERACQFEASAL